MSSRWLGKSRLWGRGYTIVPVAVRKILGLGNGDELVWRINDRGEVVVYKAR